MLASRISRLNPSHLFALILFFGLLAMTARNAVDPDLWWHLRTGQWIMQTGHVPRTDPFSFTRAGSPWISHEWLSEIIFYETWKFIGPAGLIVFASIVTTIGFMLLYFRCPQHPYWAAGAVALGALASAPAFGVRPQMFTFTLCSLLLWLMDRGEERPRLLLWIPLLFLIWLNLHAGFAIGPALIVAYALGLVWECISGSSSWNEVKPVLGRITAIFLLCMALVPINPSGAQLYAYPWDVLRSASMRSFIVEWFAPDFHELRYTPLLLTCLILITALANPRYRPKARVLLPLFGTLLAALDAVRHIPIFMLIAVPVMALMAPSTIDERVGLMRPYVGSRTFRNGFLLVAASLMAVFTVVRWLELARNQSANEAQSFPRKAVDHLISTGFNQPVFAYYDWGGYVIWRLYPETRVFVDGRADLYGSAILNDFKTTIAARDDWQQILAANDVNAVLIPPNSALAQALALDSRWKKAYADGQAIFFIREPFLPSTAIVRLERKKG
jgi:hypothetical protein